MANEGITLLSLYNDEEDDDEEEEDHGSRSSAPPEAGGEPGGAAAAADHERAEAAAAAPEVLAAEATPPASRPWTPVPQSRTPILSDDDMDYKSLRSPTPPPLSLPSLVGSFLSPPLWRLPFPVSEPFVERVEVRGSLAIVDYGHDEAAMSPEAEDDEIGGSSNVMLGMELRMSGEGTTPTGTVHILTPPSAPSSQSAPPSSDAHDQSKPEAAAEIETIGGIGPEGDPCPANTVEPMDVEIDSDPLNKFLPPPVLFKCSDDLQEKINKFLVYKRAGKSFNTEVRKKKDYRNPDFLQHAVSYQSIDQLGSCFCKDVFDPHGYDKSDYYDEIEADMKHEIERKEQERKRSPKIDFITGGTQPAAVASTLKLNNTQIAVASIAAAASAGLQKTVSPAVLDTSARDVKHNKKSKWDKVETDARNPLPFGGNDVLSAAGVHAMHLSAANAGGGYAAFAPLFSKDKTVRRKYQSGHHFQRQQKRKEADEKKSSERKFEKRS